MTMTTPDRNPSGAPCPSVLAHLAALAFAAGAALISGETTAQGTACPAAAPGRLFVSSFESLPPGDDLTADGPFATRVENGTVMRGMRATPWIAHVPITGEESPLVVILPAVGVPLSGYESVARHLATHGFIAVRAAPPSSAFAPDHVAMALDLRAVIDATLASAEVGPQVDETRIAAGGHGDGGKVAIMAAADDLRIRALLLFDPLNIHGPGGSAAPNIVPQPTGSIAIPMGVLGELSDTAGAMACAPEAINYQVLFNAASATRRGYEWTIPGAAHMDFVSDPEACGFSCGLCLAPTAPVAQTRAFIRATSVAFLRTHLDIDEPACEWLTGDRLRGGIGVRQRILP